MYDAIVLPWVASVYDATMSHPPARPKRYALAIELTSYCNQKCSYCYNAWRDDGGKSTGALPTEQLLALVDRALTEVDFDHVTITGGEPFSRQDIFEVLDVCTRHGVAAHIISNGGLITNEICARLKSYKLLGIQVTLDGPTRELHDEHVGGVGHHERTLRGMRALVAHELPLVGSIVITRKNASFVGEVLEQFRAFGVRSVALSRFSPAGYAAAHVAELLPSRSDMIRALEQAEPFSRDHGIPSSHDTCASVRDRARRLSAHLVRWLSDWYRDARAGAWPTR
ncbi:MAG: radical SAM protein [Polyangiaceae bacterium]